MLLIRIRDGVKGMRRHFTAQLPPKPDTSGSRRENYSLRFERRDFMAKRLPEP